MKIYELEKYSNEIRSFREKLDLSFLSNKTILISGASGTIISYLIDTLLIDKNQKTNLIILVHSDKSKTRFPTDSRISYLYGDVTDSSVFSTLNKSVDIFISGASITDPKGYSSRPIDTMLINFYGTKNLLDVAVKNNALFLLLSSCEIYGIADVSTMNEEYCGKINTMDVRSCYNESKRASETLCVAYAKEFNIDIRIARISRSFGPTQSIEDTKALSQFIKNGLLGQDIILKSSGNQLFSYTYVADIVTGLLCILEKGQPNQAYNVCSDEIIKLKDMAKIVADHVNKKVIINCVSDELSKGGYSRTQLAIQDPSKLKKLGWSPSFKIKDSIEFTMDVLKELYFN